MTEIFLFSYKIFIKDMEAYLQRNERYNRLQKLEEISFSVSEGMFKIPANRSTIQGVREIYGAEAKYDGSFLKEEKKVLEAITLLKEEKQNKLCDTKFYEYQEKIFQWVKQRKKIALFMDMGTGKTLVTLNFLMYHRPKKVLIICPKVAMYVWQSEFRKHIKDNPYTIIPLNKGTSKDKADKVIENNKENTVL
ncbi:MAG TPA: SNF2-related protein, partial [Petrotogaceae bacterium]|nr:SNF2-related protein [Petrotogaceae bacterium]